MAGVSDKGPDELKMPMVWRSRLSLGRTRTLDRGLLRLAVNLRLPAKLNAEYVTVSQYSSRRLFHVREKV